MLRQFLQGENLDFAIWWLVLVTTVLEQRSLPNGVVVEESRWPCGVMR